jgi:hypothetical protein
MGRRYGKDHSCEVDDEEVVLEVLQDLKGSLVSNIRDV